ncbi:MAG: TldD/PmbA family protein [Promethearchaeota archaeon]|nr:MAG: TldD/PmbA family protein [Candidatus Lokiarchaeota archaeon]
MIEKLQSVIKHLENKGAEFVEARYDELNIQTIIKEKERIEECKKMKRAGAGFNVYYKGATGYAFSADLTDERLIQCAESALSIAKASSTATKIKSQFPKDSSVPKVDLKPSIKEPAWEEDLDYKMELVNRMQRSAKEYGEKISSLRLFYADLSGEKYFVNSEGRSIHWFPHVLDLRCLVISKNEQGNLLTAFDSVSGSIGLEYIKNEGTTPEDIGKNAALWANEKLKAKAAPAGKFTALCENLLTGVLAHESFGHLTEGDFVISKASPIHNKLGEKLGSEHVTIIDEGVIPIDKDVCGFWLPYDDQGIKTTRTVLMDKGILKGFLHSRATANHFGHDPTGNARAVNYTFPPIPRMKNTYFAPGDLSEEEALEEIKSGIYAIQTLGGQVELDGSFIFQATRGYWIENGEKKYPLKDVTLSGNILELLKNVKGATKDFKLLSGYFGGCGKDGQFPLPVGTGGPKLLVDQVRFGGES